jgi:hypothetical protein
MATKRKGVNLGLNINVDISKETKEQVKEEDEFYGSKVALADDPPNFQEEDPPVSEVLKDDEPDEADNASNAEKITAKDESVNNVERASSSNVDNSAPPVLQVNDDVVKYSSFSTSGERNNSDKVPTSTNKMKILEVNAELCKHNLPSNLIAVSLEGSSQNSEAHRRSRDNIKKFEIENGGCIEGYAPGETSRIMRNIIVISIAFMVHFTAFSGTSNLQSSINAIEGLGTASLMSIYVSMMISTVFLPVIVIRLVMFIVY